MDRKPSAEPESAGGKPPEKAKREDQAPKVGEASGGLKLLDDLLQMATSWCVWLWNSVRAMSESRPGTADEDNAMRELESEIKRLQKRSGFASMDLCLKLEKLAEREKSLGNVGRAMAVLELSIEIAGALKDAGTPKREELGRILDELREEIRSKDARPDEIFEWACEMAKSANVDAPEDLAASVVNFSRGRWSNVAHSLQVVPGPDGEALSSEFQGRNANRKVQVAEDVTQSQMQDALGLPEKMLLSMADTLPLPTMQIEDLGQSRVLFTAPHGTYVVRKEGELHLAENYAAFVAYRLAELCEGTYIGWSPEEIFRSCETKLPHLKAYDPNFMPLGAEKVGGFHDALKASLSSMQQPGDGSVALHFDCHGRRSWDVDGTPGAVSVGLGALERFARTSEGFYMTHEAVVEVKNSIVKTIQEALGSEWVVDADPKYAGAGSDKHRTMTRQSVDLTDGRILAVQLEMSRDFRLALVLDSQLLKRLAATLRSLKL